VLTGIGCALCVLAHAAEEVDVSQVPADSGALEEIIVTATRRAEPLSKVPISISALNQQSLDQAGAKSMADIAALTPGVDFGSAWYSNGSLTQISIRGISQGSGSPTTGLYIDDSPVQVRINSSSQLGNPYPLLFDLDRVEILRGPQGTLFGAGAEAGTVRFITPEPSLTTYSEYARAEGSYTDYGAPSYEAGAAVGGPILDNELGFRVSVWGRHDGGWVDRQNWETGALDPNANWDDESVMRAALTFAPSDALRITPSVFYQNTHTNDTGLYWQPLSNPDTGKYVNGNPVQEEGSDHFTLVSLKVAAGLPWADFTSVSSYFHRNGASIYDDTTFESEIWAGQPYPTLPGQVTPDFHAQTQNILTQELRLSSPQTDTRFKWVAGLFYSNSRQEETSYGQDEFLPQLIYDSYGLTLEQFFGVPSLWEGKYSIVTADHSWEKQAALYLHGSYDLLSSVSIGAGVRVAKVETDYYQFNAGPVDGAPHSFAGDQKATPVTPQFNLDYQVTPDDMVYGTVAEGYRLGGVNGPIPLSQPCIPALAQLGLSAAPPTYGPDSVWNFEIGTKDKLANGRLVLDLSAFHDQWRNIQQSVSLAACGYEGFVGNLGRAISNGFDLAVQANISNGLRVGLALGYTDAYYARTIAVPPTIIVQKGWTLGNSPWIATVTPEYDFHLGEQDFYLRAQDKYHSHNSGNWAGNTAHSLSYDPDLPLPPSSNLLDLRAGMLWGGLDASIFANNALNTHPGLSLSHPLPGDPLFYNATFRPRTIGVTLVYRH
jgi:iron complex outermembrane receptor protein